MTSPEPLPESLARLASTVAEAATGLRRAGHADLTHLAARLDAMALAFEPPVEARPGVAPEAVAEWLHALRTPTNAIACWVVVLGRTQDHLVWQRSVAVLERNASTLEQLLAQPPA
jgi:hypothetical protein